MPTPNYRMAFANTVWYIMVLVGAARKSSAQNPRMSNMAGKRCDGCLARMKISLASFSAVHLTISVSDRNPGQGRREQCLRLQFASVSQHRTRQYGTVQETTNLLSAHGSIGRSGLCKSKSCRRKALVRVRRTTSGESTTLHH